MGFIVRLFIFRLRRHRERQDRSIPATGIVLFHSFLGFFRDTTFQRQNDLAMLLKNIIRK